MAHQRQVAAPAYRFRAVRYQTPYHDGVIRLEARTLRRRQVAAPLIGFVPCDAKPRQCGSELYRNSCTKEKRTRMRSFFFCVLRLFQRSPIRERRCAGGFFELLAKIIRRIKGEHCGNFRNAERCGGQEFFCLFHLQRVKISHYGNAGGFFEFAEEI